MGAEDRKLRNRPAQLPVLTMVTGYSRWLSGVLIPTRSSSDLFAGLWQLIERLASVPRVLVWDGEGAIGRRRPARVELTAECQAFRGTLGAKVLVCKPADPSFLPGRSFTGPHDFNAQLQQWLALVNTRRRRALGCTPTERIGPGRSKRFQIHIADPRATTRLITRIGVTSSDAAAPSAVRLLEEVPANRIVRLRYGGRARLRVCRAREGARGVDL